MSDHDQTQSPLDADPADQIPDQVLAEASAAAKHVFDRAMHLMSPNQVFVDEAVAAAGAVFINALAGNIHRRAQLAAAALNIRDQRNALRVRLDTAHQSLAIDEFDQDSCTTLETTIEYAVNAYHRVAESEAAADTRIRQLRGALRDVVSAARTPRPIMMDTLDLVVQRAEAALAADQL